MSDFCDLCGVTLDLHFDREEPEPIDCESAGRKVDLMNAFFGSFVAR